MPELLTISQMESRIREQIDGLNDGEAFADLYNLLNGGKNCTFDEASGTFLIEDED